MVPEFSIMHVAERGFSSLLSRLAADYISRKNRKIRVESGVIERDLRAHLEVTYNKCMYVKTILNAEKTSNTLDIYVGQNFRVNNEDLDQYKMIDLIRDGKSVILIGEGGGGKSMFMRYLWISYFIKSDGKIPFFIELRNLNNFTHNNIKDFIFHSIIQSGSSITQSDFNDALREGEFILFLDGFDEINYEQRDKFQAMILSLRDANAKLTIVLTSRADERFGGWERFIQARVLPLKRVESRLLIERSDYNSDFKRKFLAKFDEIYTHSQDFLSNPLLAYMMLVTFSYNPDIPNKMFQFYEQAFEALYYRHDLTKNYTRKFYCKIDKYQFIRLTAYFCLKTYFDEKFEFTKIDLIETINKVKKLKKFQSARKSTSMIWCKVYAYLKLMEFCTHLLIDRFRNISRLFV